MINQILNIEDLIKKVKDFPTLPTIYNALMDLISNPRTTVNDLSNLISQDQASAAKVLKAVNSPIYGFYGRITSINQAISFLGFEEIKNLITALTIIDIFSKSVSDTLFNPVEFWKHSIAVGIITRLIGHHTNAKNIESYFLSGILHDLGKLFFLKVIPKEYSKVIQYSLENKKYLLDSEMKLLGITHTVIGELIAEKWSLPKSIKNSIRYHNTGIVNGEIDHLVSSVHIANIASSILGLGYRWEHLVPQPNYIVWKELNLSKDFFKMNIKKILNDYDESIKLLLKN
jgi:HD-like signal output (HDOD) protein